MKTNHLSESEIQEFVVDKTNCQPEVIAHMHLCEYCQTKAHAYELVISEIKQAPNPKFEFDVSALLLSRLPDYESNSKRSPVIYYMIISILFLLMGTASYLCRVPLENIYKKYVYQIVAGLSKGLIYTILAATLFILLFQSFELYKRYRRKLDDLNFY